MLLSNLVRREKISAFSGFTLSILISKLLGEFYVRVSAQQGIIKNNTCSRFKIIKNNLIYLSAISKYFLCNPTHTRNIRRKYIINILQLHDVNK